MNALLVFCNHYHLTNMRSFCILDPHFVTVLFFYAVYSDIHLVEIEVLFSHFFDMAARELEEQEEELGYYE